MMNGRFAVAAVAVGCNCPIPVQLRWVDAMQGLDSNPDVDVVVVIAVVDAANHANDVLAILIVDVLATFYLSMLLSTLLLPYSFSAILRCSSPT